MPWEAGGATAAPHGLVGRDAELGKLADVLARAGSGTIAAVVIRGEAGFGKTALLDAVAATARARGWTVLAVRGIESEAVLAGAGLLGALTPLRGDLGSVPPAQSEALVAALGWGAATMPGERFLVGAATLSRLAAAASRAPVLVAVDDVQWVDMESAEALSFAARRLGHDQVAFVVNHRLGVPLSVSLDGFDVVPLDGLEPRAARALLGSGFSAGVVERLVSATGGNPLALRECERTLTKAQRAGAAALPQALPVPDRLSDVYVRELDSLSAGAWRAALLCAASTDQASAPVFAALAAEGLDPESCLTDAGDLLSVQDSVLTFRHPLLRSATWKRTSDAERRSAHQSLADVVADPAGGAWHRAEATPGYDEALADELAAVADADRSRRGFAAASAAMERAARLTADPYKCNQRLAAATDDAYLAGDASRVRRLAGEVLGSAVEAEPRARALVALGMLEWHHGTVARSRELFEQAAELATGRLLMRTLCELVHICHFVDDVAGVTAAADRASAVADRTDPEQAMLAAYLSGAARVVEGRPDLGAPLVHRAVELLESDPVLRDDPRHLLVALFSTFWLKDPTVALAYFDRRINRAREMGALGMLAFGLSMASGGLSWLGDHVRAYAFAGEAIELLEALGYAADPGVAFEVAAEECAGRGMHDEAARLLDRARRNVAIHAFDAMPPHPFEAAMVARCEALVAANVDEAVSAFDRSLALHALASDRFEVARTRLLYGMRLRRAGRRVDARAQLDAARRAFMTMDLTLWAERAAQELAGTEERVSRDATRLPLTSQETRVALLVAQGLTNREVAAALFLSPKTVEHHVGAVLRKRGLRSRTELARALATESEAG